jgi:hypothetical protein
LSGIPDRPDASANVTRAGHGKLSSLTGSDAMTRRGFPNVKTDLAPVFGQRRFDQLPDGFEQICNGLVVSADASFQFA